VDARTTSLRRSEVIGDLFDNPWKVLIVAVLAGLDTREIQ